MKRPGRFALIAVAVVAAMLGFAFNSTHWLRGAEHTALDARFSIRGDQGPADQVVIVAIDDKTLAAAGGASPLDRRQHARVIRQLAKAGAAVIAYDVPFDGPGVDEESNASLIEAVHDAPRTVLGTGEVSDDGSTVLFGDGAALAYSGATPAATGLPRDSDGKVRRLDIKVNQVDSLAIAAARLKLGRAAHFPEVGDELIDFRGPAGTFAHVSFADVEAGTVPASTFRRKVVVVGATADRLGGARATPTSDRMAEPELHASAVASALEDFPLAAAPWWLGAFSILLMAGLTPLAARRWGALRGVLVGVAGVAVYVVAAQLLFDAGVVVAMVPPLVSALVAFALTPVAASRFPVAVGDLMERLGPSQANRRTRRVLATTLMGSGVFIVATVLLLQSTDALERFELSTVNKRFDARGSSGPPDDVVLVAIDEYTFTLPPKPQWPFDRADHAKVIRNLLAAGADVIAYDVQFTEEGPDAAADQDLANAVEEADGRIVLASTEVRSNGETEIFGGGESLASTKAVPAFSAFPQDADSKVRRLERDKNGLVHFDIASARLATGRDVQAPGYYNWIDFPGPPGTVRTLSFVDVKNGRFDAAEVRGKVVVVGGTANVLQDYHGTSSSGGALMAGPEIHVAGIQTALEGFPLRDGPGWLNLLSVIVLGLLAPLAGLRLKVVPALLVGAAGIVVLIVGSQVLFEREGVIIHVSYPLIAGLAGVLVTGVVHGLTTAFEREQARDAFARFVPEAVVDQVLADAEGVRLGGVRGEATVMFSDLRGFTSFSETLEPERVIESLNRYLTEMSEAILDHGGTLVAYMGDGIMAVFGAPLKQEDHADRALEAARDMLGRMAGFNGWLREQGLHDGFKMGIGLNSGPVMSGNVGSERRLEYTALGDTTNTAARLEGMTKGTPHQLYISDTTRQALTRPAEDLVEVGEAEVRGRKAKVKLWSLRDGEPPTPLTEPSQRVEA